MEQYDAKLGYRAVEAMRNFVQHRGLIVSSLSLTASVNKADADRVVKRTITPSLSVSRIKKMGKFKASILEELESLSETMDLKPLIREAMEGYASVHAFARELSAKHIAPWEQSISATRKAYTDKFGEGEFVLSVSEVDDAGKTQASVVIFDDFVKRRKSLEEKNRTDISYNSQIISSES